MLAVHLEEGKVSVRETSEPERPQGHALLKLVSGGVCNTDLELQRGYYGFRGTPGHEFVAEVVDAAARKWIGRRVVGEINLACGVCGWCARGLGRHCPNRTVLGIVKHPGAFSELFTLPEANLHEVPERVPTERAAFAEPVAAACEILDQVAIPQDAPVAVLGDGKLGLLIAQVLQAHGAQIFLYGRHPGKMAIAAATGVRPRLSTGGLPGAAYEYVVDATGSSEGLMQAVHMTCPRGTLVMKSTVHDRAAIDTAPIIVNEITLVGSRCGRFAPALNLIAGGKLNLDPMIHARYPLRQAPAAFEKAASRGVLKVLLDG